MDALVLRWTMTADPVVDLRSLTGLAEMAVVDTSIVSAVALIDALVDRDDVVEISTPDRDRLLARVLAAMVGDRVDSTLSCESCASVFDLDFSLCALIEHLAAPWPDGVVGTDRPGVWQRDGIHFRFPTGRDELAARRAMSDASEGNAHLVAEWMRKACLFDVDVDEATAASIEADMALMAPTLSAPIGATCPECSITQTVAFDVQRYLLSSIVAARPRLVRDVHVIASAYGWSRQEILGLERSERETYVDAIGARRQRVMS